MTKTIDLNLDVYRDGAGGIGWPAPSRGAPGFVLAAKVEGHTKDGKHPRITIIDEAEARTVTELHSIWRRILKEHGKIFKSGWFADTKNSSMAFAWRSACRNERVNPFDTHKLRSPVNIWREDNIDYYLDLIQSTDPMNSSGSNDPRLTFALKGKSIIRNQLMRPPDHKGGSSISDFPSLAALAFAIEAIRSKDKNEFATQHQPPVGGWT